MIEYNIREPHDPEIYKSVGVLYSSLGRTLNKGVNEEEVIAWKTLIKKKLENFSFLKKMERFLALVECLYSKKCVLLAIWEYYQNIGEKE